MENTPHNVVIIEINKQKLKSYITDADNARVLHSGILEPASFFTIVEKLLLNNFHGIILFDFIDVQKVVYVKDGEVIFARSSVNDERLGETLCRMGKLTIDEMNRASKEITPARKLGKILVENGHITPRDLWLGVRRQIFEIWGSYIMPLNHQNKPWFHVIESVIDDSNKVKPNNNMFDSLFEFLREKAGSTDVSAMPEVTADDLVCLNYLTNSITAFNPLEKAIIKHLLTVNNLSISKLAMDIKVDLKTIENALKPLLYSGMLNINKQAGRSEQKTEDVKFEELLTLTNAIMTSITEIMQKKAAHVDFKASVRDYIRLSGGMFKDCPVNENGCFDTSRITAVYKKSQLLSPYDEAVIIIKELIQFELFEMKNYLSKDQTIELENIIATLG